MNRDAEYSWPLVIGGWVIVARLNVRQWVDVRTLAFTVSWARRRVEVD